MNGKKYFVRIFVGMLAMSLIVSAAASLFFYFSASDEKTKQYYNDKEVEAAYSAQELSYVFKICGDIAKAVAGYDKTDEAFAVGGNGSELLDYCMGIFGEGYVYIFDESGIVMKTEESPKLSNFVFEKAKASNEKDFLTGFIQNGTSYVAIINTQKTTGGRKIYVMRLFEGNYFLNQKNMGAQNFIILTDSSEIYVDNKNTSSEIKSLINQVGKKEAFNQIENKSFKGKENLPVSLQLSYPQNTGIIFSYTNEYLKTIKLDSLMYAVALFFISFIVLGVIGWFISILIYHPIDELVAFAGKYTDEEKSSDEVLYISNAFKTVEKKLSVFAGEAKKDYELLKVHYIKDLLLGVILEDDFLPLFEKFGMNGYEAPFYVGILEISDFDEIEDIIDERELSKIKMQICSFIDDELMGRCVSKAVAVDKKRFAVITYGCDISKIRQNLSYIISVINAEFDVEMFAAVGHECDSLSDVRKSYESAAKAFENSFAVGFRSAVVTADDMEISKGFYYPVNLERDLINSVLRLKKDESLHIINDILDENLIGKTLTKERQNAIVFAFSATINRIVESLNKTTRDVFGEENIIFLELKMCSDASQLRAKIIQSFEKIISYMSGSDEEDLSKQLIGYIHSHYNEDISLNDIGSHFNLSPCYISTIFKEATGENFKDYLSRYRIKKAKEILTKNPSVKTKELAEMIGCNTVATLFRLFNKYEGMSPGQFVKSNQSGASKS